jgi:mRNA interferase MazF
MTPERWHLYVVDLEPREGTKPGKQRPCLAIQPTEFAAAGHPSTVILPITSRVSPAPAFPLRVRIPKGTTGLLEESDILVDQMLAWDNRLFRKDLGPLPEALRVEVERAVLDFLDFPSE